MDSPSVRPHRCGYVTILGQPNVGKSTLMNQLLRVKLSIVTPKPQTTRQRVLGVLTDDQVQIIFLDTPGIIQPKYSLHLAMMKIVDQAVQSADVLMVMTDVTSPDDPEFVEELLKSSLAASSLPKLLVMNKIDRVAKPDLLPLMDRYVRMGAFTDTIPISALADDGLDRIKSCLAKLLPEQEAFYSADVLTEQPERFFVSEIIREKIFFRFSEEIPYSTDVVIEEFKERQGHKDFIRAVIIVERESQKAILIGRKGEALKRVGAEARASIERFLERPVFLELWVKVRPDWRDNKNVLRDLGYL